MQACQLMSRNVVTARPDDDLVTAARLMREHHVGFLVVTQRTHDGNPVGVLTDRDIVVAVVARELSPDNFVVSDVMNTTQLLASEHEDLHDLLARMREAGVRRAPVISRWGKLVGVVSFDDVLCFTSDLLCDMAGSVTSQRQHEAVQRA
jgi:CBS domain-containing protein